MSDNKSNDLSYSVFVENMDRQNSDGVSLRYVLPTRIYKWVEDDSVIACYNCNKHFTMLLRRHHCRFCGRIFCAECINNITNIPKDLLSDDAKKGTWNEYFSSYIFSKDPAKHKVCKCCKDLIDFIDAVKKIIDVFIILKLNVKDLKKAGTMCKSWHHASNYILSMFREIQYKLPNSKYSDLEKSLLWNNIEYISGHNKYMVHLIKSSKSPHEYAKSMEYLKKDKTVNCWSMMCSRNCSNKLTSFDSIDLLCHSFKDVGHNDILRNTAINYLVCTDKELKCYLPSLVYYLRFDNGIIADFLVKRCINNFSLLNSLYWELQLYPKDSYHEDAYSKILDKLKDAFKEKKHESNFVKILEGYSLVKTIETIAKTICEDSRKYDDIKDKFILKAPLTSPLDSESKIKSFQMEKIRIKNSATKPIIIPCNVTSNDNQSVSILYKKEDIRKDQIVLNLIQLIDMILKRDEGLDLGLVTYNVLPTSKGSGMIEIINNSETVYYIQEKLKTSIINYILETNGDNKIKDIREAFIKSVAGYSVITYLFGIGDRHLDNIMVTKDGKLFHIDYGYILGNDPVYTNPGIRITPEIIEALGGLSSKNYQIYTELCSRIYNCLRKHVGLFINMLNILPELTDMGKITSNEITEMLIKKFIPGENSENAKLHFINQIEKQNYIEKIKDWCHYHSKEKTVSSAMSRLTYAMANLMSYANTSISAPSNIIDNSITNDKTNNNSTS